jgi:hypothetical protein
MGAQKPVDEMWRVDCSLRLPKMAKRFIGSALIIIHRQDQRNQTPGEEFRDVAFERKKPGQKT